MGILEVVHPARLVGVDIDDACIEEVERTAERARDSLVDGAPFGVEEGGVFGDHHHLVRIDLIVRVALAFGWIDAIATQRGSGVVKPFVFIVHLSGVEAAITRHGMRVVDTLDGAALVFVSALPRDGARPVEVRCDGVSELILGDHKELIAAVSWIGQTGADDGVAHPVNELAILGVGDFRLVHPKRFERDAARIRLESPQTVSVRRSHLKGSAFDEHHPVRARLVVGGHSGADQFATVTGKHFPARCEQPCRHAHDRYLLYHRLYVSIFSVLQYSDALVPVSPPFGQVQLQAIGDDGFVTAEGRSGER